MKKGRGVCKGVRGGYTRHKGVGGGYTLYKGVGQGTLDIRV